MSAVIIGGTRVSLDPSKAIGQGGEAVVYEYNGQALKVYHDKNNPLFNGDPHAQKAAEERILTHQRKLPAFPNNLPPQVIVPIDLARDKSGRIVGYTMKFLKGLEVLMKYSDKTFRLAGVSNETVVEKFRAFRTITAQVHRAGVVIGDNNDLNVMIGDKEIYLCDADSFQYKDGTETFYCKTFTHTFVDPTLCDPKATSLSLIKPHNENSDWYAFLVMLFQSLLFVGPYGGVYKPKNLANKINHDERPLKRITVFNPEVRYPKPAVRYGVLPDEFLDYCVRVFEKDARGEFPESLLDKIVWTKCSGCGLEHARSKCPDCAAPGAVKEVITIRGSVTSSEIFKTHGLILHAVYQSGKLRWVYTEGTSIYREDKVKVLDGQVTPSMRFRTQGDKTLIGMGSRLAILGPSSKEMKLVDTFGSLPMFDSNALKAYWLNNGRLLKEGTLGEEYVGDVLPNQSLFWVGDSMGFGFYRAGNITTAFSFHPDKSGIYDGITIPPIKGQLLDSTCVLMKNTAWFFTSTSEAGKTLNRCYMISNNNVVASAEVEGGDPGWLGNIRGKCALSSIALMSSTDDGLVKIEANGNQLQISKEFPDTEPFVNSKVNLVPGDGGVYVIGAKSISLLRIK